MYQDPTDANLYTIVPNAGRNTQYRSVTKNMTSQELQTFSQGLENEIKSIPLDPNLVNEQTLCAEMDILYDPRPNRAVDFSKPTAMIHITDENDVNTACHYGYRKSRYTYGAYNLISVKAVYVQTTRKERNETINDGYYLDVNSQASLDLYNRQSNSAMVDCSEEVKVQLRARGIADSSYLTCQSRQVWWDYGRTYSVADGASCIGRDEAISLGYANDYNFIRCVHADSNTVDNWNAEMWSNLVPKFTDLVGEKTAGYSKFMYYPIAYFNDRANECAGKDTSNMTHGQSFLNLSSSLQSKGSKVAIGDICAADYGAGLRSVVGGFIYQTHIRVYEIGPTANVHAIVRVQLKNNQNQLQVLPPTMYEMRITGNTAYVKINDAVNLDNIASVIINYN